MKGNFDSLILDSRPVVVDFHASWCGPCKTQAPILQQLATHFGEKIRIIKIDVDANNSIAGRYNVRSVPTLMVFQNGSIKHSQPGVHTLQQLQSILNPLIQFSSSPLV